MNQSLWEQDLKGSKVINKFLDKYFYETYFKKIKNEIFSNIGLDKDYLKSKANYIIENNKSKVTKISKNRKICFFYSNYLPEKPVNLLINKELIKKTSTLTLEH